MTREQVQQLKSDDFTNLQQENDRSQSSEPTVNTIKDVIFVNDVCTRDVGIRAIKELTTEEQREMQKQVLTEQVFKPQQEDCDESSIDRGKSDEMRVN